MDKVRPHSGRLGQVVARFYPVFSVVPFIIEDVPSHDRVLCTLRDPATSPVSENEHTIVDLIHLKPSSLSLLSYMVRS